MTTSYLINATGFAALALNISGLVRTSDRNLRATTGWASALWAVNNLLIGANSAAALSMLSAGRQATAAAVHERASHLKDWTCLLFVLITLAVGALTWNGPTTLCTTTGSVLATVAMFYLRGTPLRLAMAVVAALWMYNAIVYHSWWQIIANALAAAAAAFGAWRSRSPE